MEKEKYRRKEAWRKQSVQQRLHKLSRAVIGGDTNNRTQQENLGQYFKLPGCVDPDSGRLGNMAKYEI